MSLAPQLMAQPKFQNILFTTDFSSCSEAALPYAKAIAERYGSTVHVLHVVQPEAGLVGELGAQMPDPNVEIGSQNLARERMGQLFRAGVLSNVPSTQLVLTGVVWDVVCELVEKLHIDLIVLSTHGRRGLKQLMMGSVSEQIFRRANCPVLTVGPEIQKNRLADRKVNRVLYATDFSPASLKALEYGAFVAHTQGAEMTLLHALNYSEITLNCIDEQIGSACQRLSALAPRDAGLDYEVVVQCGPAAELILAATRAVSADLVVMGAHHGASASAHMPWSVAHQVVCNAPCPVLTVRG